MYKREWTRFGASLRDGAKPLRVQVPPSPVRSGPRSLRSTARGRRARQFLYTREETKSIGANMRDGAKPLRVSLPQHPTEARCQPARSRHANDGCVFRGGRAQTDRGAGVDAPLLEVGGRGNFYIRGKRQSRSERTCATAPIHSESRYLNTPQKHGVCPLARSTRTTGRVFHGSRAQADRGIGVDAPLLEVGGRGNFYTHEEGTSEPE